MHKIKIKQGTIKFSLVVAILLIATTEAIGIGYYKNKNKMSTPHNTNLKTIEHTTNNSSILNTNENPNNNNQPTKKETTNETMLETDMQIINQLFQLNTN